MSVTQCKVMKRACSEERLEHCLGYIQEWRLKSASLPVMSMYACLSSVLVSLTAAGHQSQQRGVMWPLSRAEPRRIDEAGVRKRPDVPPKYPILVTPPAWPGLNRFHAVWGGRLRADCVRGGGWEVGGHHWKVLNDSKMVGLRQDNAGQ